MSPPACRRYRMLEATNAHASQQGRERRAHPRRANTPLRALSHSSKRRSISCLLCPVGKSYSKSPNAPATAAASPTSGTYIPVAAPLLCVAAGLAAVDVAAAVLDAAELEVEAAPAPCLTVAGSRLPQSLLHWSEPGLAVLHWMKVYWHSRKGRDPV